MNVQLDHTGRCKESDGCGCSDSSPGSSQGGSVPRTSILLLPLLILVFRRVYRIDS
jgi:hypothetical protein